MFLGPSLEFDLANGKKMEFSKREVGGFIDSVEVEYYSALVQRSYSERGRLLDGGCFIGSSTRALLSGLGCEGAPVHGIPPVIAIDRFIVADNYLIEFFASRGMDIRLGESFLPVFLKSIDPFQRLVEIRAGDVQRIGRVSDSIEIMAVDIAKSAGINSFICANWLPRLLVGGHLIQQDFYAPSHAWIATSMGVILDRFSIVQAKVGESAVFKLESSLTAFDIRKAISVVPWSEEGIKALIRVEEAVGARHAAPLRIMRALALRRVGQLDKAADIVSELLSGPLPEDRKWMQWLGMAMMAVDPQIAEEARMLAEVYIQDLGARFGERHPAE